MSGACKPSSADDDRTSDTDNHVPDQQRNPQSTFSAPKEPEMSIVQTVSRASFQSDVLESSLPVVVDFYADWCPPCRRLGPVLDRLAQEFSGKVSFVKINSDEENELAEHYNVTSLPTLIFFENGQIAGQFAGLPQESALREELARWVNPQSSVTQ